MSIKAITNRIISFTLAEIMMVLVVIGVISSLVIPPTVQYFQEAHLKVQWKEAYAMLAQVTDSIIAEGQSFPLGTLQNVFTNSTVMRDKYLQYLKHIKSCPTPSTGNCWHNAGVAKFSNGSTASSCSEQPGAILNNGAFLLFAFYSSNCTFMQGSVPVCGWIVVDVNGSKGPNVVNKDLYAVWVTSNGIKPFGTQGDGRKATCTPSSGDWGCSAMYLHN
ncbi:MAG: type II secretion system protein [bacterium]